MHRARQVPVTHGCTCHLTKARNGKGLTLQREHSHLALQQRENTEVAGAGVLGTEETGHGSACQATSPPQRRSDPCPQTELSPVRATGILFTLWSSGGRISLKWDLNINKNDVQCVSKLHW